MPETRDSCAILRSDYQNPYDNDESLKIYLRKSNNLIWKESTIS